MIVCRNVWKQKSILQVMLLVFTKIFLFYLGIYTFSHFIVSIKRYSVLIWFAICINSFRKQSNIQKEAELLSYEQLRNIE